MAIIKSGRCEDDSGAGHALEHMHLVGNTRLPGHAAVRQAASQFGGDLEQWHIRPSGTTVYMGASSPEHAPALVEFLGSVVEDPLIDDEIFTTEIVSCEPHRDGETPSPRAIRGRMYHEARRTYLDPRQHGAVSSWAVISNGTPFRYVAGGQPSEILSLRPEHLEKWHARWYGAECTAVITAGPIDPDEAYRLVEGSYPMPVPRHQIERAASATPSLDPCATTISLPWTPEVANIVAVSRWWPMVASDVREYELLQLLGAVLASREARNANGQLLVASSSHGPVSCLAAIAGLMRADYDPLDRGTTDEVRARLLGAPISPEEVRAVMGKAALDAARFSAQGWVKALVDGAVTAADSGLPWGAAFDPMSTLHACDPVDLANDAWLLSQRLLQGQPFEFTLIPDKSVRSNLEAAERAALDHVSGAQLSAGRHDLRRSRRSSSVTAPATAGPSAEARPVESESLEIDAGRDSSRAPAAPAKSTATVLVPPIMPFEPAGRRLLLRKGPANIAYVDVAFDLGRLPAHLQTWLPIVEVLLPEALSARRPFVTARRTVRFYAFAARDSDPDRSRSAHVIGLLMTTTDASDLGASVRDVIGSLSLLADGMTVPSADALTAAMTSFRLDRMNGFPRRELAVVYAAAASISSMGALQARLNGTETWIALAEGRAGSPYTLPAGPAATGAVADALQALHTPYAVSVTVPDLPVSGAVEAAIRELEASCGSEPLMERKSGNPVRPFNSALWGWNMEERITAQAMRAPAASAGLAAIAARFMAQSLKERLMRRLERATDVYDLNVVVPNDLEWLGAYASGVRIPRFEGALEAALTDIASGRVPPNSLESRKALYRQRGGWMTATVAERLRMEFLMWIRGELPVRLEFEHELVDLVQAKHLAEVAAAALAGERPLIEAAPLHELAEIEARAERTFDWRLEVGDLWAAP